MLSRITTASCLVVDLFTRAFNVREDIQTESGAMLLRMCLKLTIVLVGMLTSASRVEAAVIYENVFPNRPLTVTDLSFANGLFTASIDYTTSFGDTIVDPTAVTGSTIAAIQTALLDQLIPTSLTITTTHLIIAVTDPAPKGDLSRFDARAITHSGGSMKWSTSGSYSGLDALTSGQSEGLVTFTPQAAAVPEPSTFALALLCGGPLLYRRLRRRQS